MALKSGTILEISEKCRVPVRALKRLERAGYIRFSEDEENERAAAIRLSLSRGNGLSLAHTMALLDDPGLFEELRVYAMRARKIVYALGDVEGQAAPSSIAVLIEGAAAGEADAIAGLIAWIKGALPGQPVSYLWLGARLVYRSLLQAADVKNLPLAILNLKKSPEFSGCFFVADGKTFFRRPAEKTLDL